jgi:hypothetical protein
VGSIWGKSGHQIFLRQGEFFAESVALPFVRAKVNRLLVDERVIEPVKLLLDRLCNEFLRAVDGACAGISDCTDLRA